jgi:hypothetical protein
LERDIYELGKGEECACKKLSVKGRKRKLARIPAELPAPGTDLILDDP